jgi:hypothetical protein
MEHNIGVGAIVGLTMASSGYVYNNEKFSSAQKMGLLILIIIPPVQWVAILIVLAYNTNKENNTIEKKAEKKLDDTISNLADLKEKGILTKEEYTEKVKKIELEKEENFLINSLEYKQLKNLLDSGVLNKAEFENKIKVIKDKQVTNNTPNIQKIEKTETVYSETVYSEIIYRETIDKKLLKIILKNNETIGASVFIDDKIAPNGIYIYNTIALNKHLTHKLIIENGKIKERYFIEKRKGLIIEMIDENVFTIDDKVFLENGEKAPNGKYRMGFMSGKMIVENGVIINFQ